MALEIIALDSKSLFKVWMLRRSCISLQEGWDSEKEESLSAVITFSVESGSDCSGSESHILWFADLAPASLGFEAPSSCLLMSLHQAFLLTQQTNLQLLAYF